MADATLVNVLNTSNELLVHPNCRLLMKSLMRHDVIEQLAVLAVLHDEEKFALSFDDFVQLDDVRVSHLFQNLNLATNPLDVLLVFDSRLF